MISVFAVILVANFFFFYKLIYFLLYIFKSDFILFFVYFCFIFNVFFMHLVLPLSQTQTFSFAI